jgi:hypothetical protein
VKRYAIEIYPPGNSGRDVACRIESDVPFLPFNVGDLINPRLWPSEAISSIESAIGNRKFGIVLRVTGVEHFIVQNDGEMVQHKLGIFTASLDDIEKSRPGFIG